MDGLMFKDNSVTTLALGAERNRVALGKSGGRAMARGATDRVIDRKPSLQRRAFYPEQLSPSSWDCRREFAFAKGSPECLSGVAVETLKWIDSPLAAMDNLYQMPRVLLPKRGKRPQRTGALPRYFLGDGLAVCS
jgi:hypothetical protein